MNYFNIYNNIIEKARSENRNRESEYYENHHIYPKCFCKDDLDYLAKDKRNLVLLTAKEHFIAHWILSKVFTEGKEKFQMLNAFSRMIYNGNEYQDRNYRITSRTYNELKKKLGIEMSERKKKWHEDNNFSGSNHPMYGKKKTKEQCDNQSQKMKEDYDNGTRISTKGKKSGRYIGDYKTPFGIFSSISECVDILGDKNIKVGKDTLRNWCRKHDSKFNQKAITQCNIPKEWINKTYKEIGFGFNHA